MVLPRALTIATLLLLPGVAFASFSDVPSNHPNADAINYVQAQGIVSGYSDGTYRPDQTINRAEFIKIVAGVDIQMIHDYQNQHPNGPEYEDGICLNIFQNDDVRMPFSDVQKTDWFANPVCHGFSQNLINGYPDGTFRPAANITVVEAAKILTGLFKIPTLETDPWYKGYVDSLAGKNAIPVSIVRLDQQITRGEMAEMIYRLKTHNTGKQSQNYEDLSAVWQVFNNTRYRFQLKYSGTSTASSNEMATAAERSSDLVVGPLALDILDPAAWSQTPDYQTIYKQYMTEPTEDYAAAIQRMNAEDQNPNVQNKEVGDIETITVAGRTAYRFWVTGSFINERGGHLLEKKQYFLYFNSRGITYAFSYSADDEALATTMLNTFQEY
jgi:hypothetical protein